MIRHLPYPTAIVGVVVAGASAASVAEAAIRALTSHRERIASLVSNGIAYTRVGSKVAHI